MRIGNLIGPSYTQRFVYFNSSDNPIKYLGEDKAVGMTTTGIGDWIANRVAEL